MTHFHGLAGLHGCMPNANDVCDTYDAAVDSMVQLHELGRKRERILRRDGYIELSLHRDGNEYIEIGDCDEPNCEEG